MLLSVHVKNFALIGEAELELSPGLNVLTGETGAGKSILIDSVSAALGGRAGSDLIGSGGDAALAELVFSVDTPEKKAELAALGVDPAEEMLILSRRITEGRSVFRINGETVPAQFVRRVTSELIDLHGQHEHQSLLHRAKHLEILDEFGAKTILPQKARTADRYRSWKRAAEDLARFSQDPESRRRELDFLNYEIAELEDARVTEGEEETLSAQYKRMNNSSRLAEAAGRMLSEFEEGDTGISERISRALRIALDAAGQDPELKETADQIFAVEDLSAGIVRALSDYAEGLTFDPAELHRVGNRLDRIHDLEHKYGRGYEALAKALTDRREKAAALLRYEDEKKRAEAALLLAEKELAEACAALSEARRAAAGPLAEAIAEGLRELNFPAVQFMVSFSETESFTAGGTDQAEFLISLNPGEPLMPLVRVASGGELSRIMLAIKTVLAEKDAVPTLIFDEIDSGISGRTAQKVSEKLSQIARFRQVLCITHLPQIAAMADRHFCVEKETESGKTRTRVRTLTPSEETEELARLLGGARITDAVRQNAAEMKELAEKMKQGASQRRKENK